MESMKKIKLIGIDPGKSGGIAIYHNKVTIAAKMPDDITGFASVIDDHRKDCHPLVFLERVSMFMSDSDKGNNGKQFRIAKMLEQYNSMITYFKIFMIPYVEITPMVWQKYLNLWVKGSSKTERKNKFKSAAMMWHPEIKVTNAISDALCILHFARRKMGEDEAWVRQRIQLEPNEELPF